MRVEILIQDLGIQRDILADELSMFTYAIDFRYNQFLNRLTVVRSIFMPLSIITGVYGTNFAIPELQQPNAYYYFYCAIFIVIPSILCVIWYIDKVINTDKYCFDVKNWRIQL